MRGHDPNWLDTVVTTGLCLFCKHTRLPSVPFYPLSVNVIVSHVDKHGVPCLEGSDPVSHAVTLDDYPHAELLDADALWDLDRAPDPLDDIDVAITVRPTDDPDLARMARELEHVPSLPDNDPSEPARRKRGRPRKSRVV